MQAPRGSLSVPEVTGGYVRLPLLVMPRRPFGGIDAPGNVFVVVFK